MPFCNRCGHGIPVDATVCPSCGEVFSVNTDNGAYNSQTHYNTYNQTPPPPRAPYESEEQAAARRQRLIDNFYLRLKWEHKAWSIMGKVMTIFGGVCAGISLICLIAAIASWSEMSAFFGAYAYVFFIYTIAVLPLGIVGIIMTGKVKKYMDGLYYDCGPAVTRGESIGMIIFNYLFNGVALVFYLINFIHIKCHKREFEEVRRLQLNSNSQSGNTYWQ